MKNTLSLQEARTLVLQAQRLFDGYHDTPAIDATLSNIEHLGYVQIDTISVVKRAHHHTLWARNPEYQTSHLDTLVADKKVFEYWSHAAAYLPMSEYQYTLPRKHAILNNEQSHWYDKDEKLMQLVLERISKEGALMVKDFEHTGKKSKEWVSKPAKKALECLFIQGDLMISSRVNFHKVYDLTSRVLPSDVDTRVPSREESTRFLITKYLKTNALGNASQMAYLLKNTKKSVTQTLKGMVENKELMQVDVQGQSYYALDVECGVLERANVKILSPFDNLLIQRKRMQALFDFEYLIECYVPQAKRKYGYFSLPILWGDKLVARMDCKADRKEKVLHIHHIALEDDLAKMDEFALDLHRELLAFLAFNNCDDFILHRSTPATFKAMFQRVH